MVAAYPVKNSMTAWVLVLTLFLLSACGSQDDDSSLPDPEPSLSKTQAFQFLNQSTFGPQDPEVTALIASGKAQWINEQMLKPASLQLPYLLSLPHPLEPQTLQVDRVDIWFRNVMYGDDLLRQRVAFALSEILVVSEISGLFDAPYALADYYDILVENAFGNYRELLEKVTLHPAMGVYLSMLGNQKPNVTFNIRPDENFARELMQLFTIGLVELNIDGSQKLDSNSQAIATYDQDTIEAYAHVFTGWHWAGGNDFYSAVRSDDNQILAMQLYPDLHDTGAKNLLNNIQLSAGQTGEQDLSDALDSIFNHDNVGPFISYRLIQRLVSSLEVFMTDLKRRQFLKMLGTSPLVGSLPLSFFPTSVQASFGNYRTIVCVFLMGGNDGFNMLIPRSNAEYNVYANSRQNLKINQSDLLAINPLISDGVDYGLHPSMTGIHQLFESGSAAMISNIGPLLEPTTKQQFLDHSVNLPPQLFSHNDQQDQWQSLKGKASIPTGWGGRLADALSPNTTAQQIPTTSSLSGASIFLSGDQITPYVMGSEGPLQFAGINDPNYFAEQRAAFEAVIGANYNSIYERAFAEVQQRALNNADVVYDAIENININTTFPDSELGKQLKTVAKLIAARDTLQMERQVFFVTKGGFDTHDAQVTQQPILLSDVSDSIKAFYDATVEMNVADQVTTFTQSDFGRTLTSNGDGTDHAWGNVQFIVGDAVDGQKLFGHYPLLDINGTLDVGGGRIIPTTSVDQYAATLAKWMGANDQDINAIAPHLSVFTEKDLGFLI